MAGMCVTAGSAASEARAAARSRRWSRACWWVSQACSRSRMNLAMLVVTDTGLPRSRTVLVPALPHFDAPAMTWKRNRQRAPGADTMIAARKSPAGAEILWIAVDAARRSRGHGTRLLGRVLDHLGADGISWEPGNPA